MSSVSKFKFNQKASCSMTRNRNIVTGFSFYNPIEVEHWRGGKKIAHLTAVNGVTNEGLNDLLDHHFDLGAAVTAWYMGLIDLSGFSALDATDIYDDIDQAGNGWDEFKDYTDNANGDSTVTRPVWNPDAASSQSISNSSQIIYDITANGTVKGLFIVGAPTGATAIAANKGDHAADGILWATAFFDQGDTAVVTSDQLKITYTVSAS